MLNEALVAESQAWPVAGVADDAILEKCDGQRGEEASGEDSRGLSKLNPRES
jgi:hypothetical protein